MKFLSGLSLALLLAAPLAAQDRTVPSAGPKTKITWKKTVIDKVFRSEGVAVADFNKDGKMDIFVGDVWYEAPDWKMHPVRDAKPWDPKGYSESFACFADDFNGDGYPDVIVIPFPGKECYWYENPGTKGGKWPAHLLTTSACNETPIYVDLFGTGKKVLVMGWQPLGKENQGQMCYFVPGKDPSKPWQRLPISEPSQPGKEVPGTQRFSHGLGHGDVNGDGRVDVICANGWWEQPAKVDGVTPWKFHAADLGPICADMFTYDLDGDGKADIISSSAHNYGMWWHQQKSGRTGPRSFAATCLHRRPKSPNCPKITNCPRAKLAICNEINKARNAQGKASWKIDGALCALAHATTQKLGGHDKADTKSAYRGIVKYVKSSGGRGFEPENVIKAVLGDLDKDNKNLASPGLAIGVAIDRQVDGRTFWAVLIGDNGAFSLPAQTHALHCVDINGDGLKDLVTGRRWWAHGPRGDANPSDPAYLYWFEAKHDKTGLIRFIPHEIDDDSGIGTQFAVMDMNGDGLLDIIISNKKGVFLFLQQRQDAKE